jgi:hypothetical protein
LSCRKRIFLVWFGGRVRGSEREREGGRGGKETKRKGEERRGEE